MKPTVKPVKKRGPRPSRAMQPKQEPSKLPCGLAAEAPAKSSPDAFEFIRDKTKPLRVQCAEVAADGLAHTALLFRSYTEHGFQAGENSPSIGDYGRALHSQIQPIVDGDLSNAERLLAMQAMTLHSIFTECARIAALNLGSPEIADRYLRLGMKAQNQSRGTIETLAEIKNPRMPVFAKQANIANNQQVNNGDAATRAENNNQQNELRTIEHAGNGILDARTPRAGAAGDYAEATVVEIDRAKDRRRKGAVKP